MAINYERKTWIDRVSENPNRRVLKDVTTEVTRTYDVTRDEGEVQIEGDLFDSMTFNLFEQRIADAFTEAQAEIDALKAQIEELKNN